MQAAAHLSGHRGKTFVRCPADSISSRIPRQQSSSMRARYYFVFFILAFLCTLALHTG